MIADRCACLAMLVLLVPAVAAAATLIDTDFGLAEGRAVGRGGAPNERVTGVLPEGWADDSGWAPVWADLRVMEVEGTRFLRVNVTKLESGRLQLTHDPLPDLAGKAYFRLALRLRSLSGAPVEVGLRMSDKPYEMYWSTQGAFSRDWRDYRYDFAMEKNSQRMGFWLNFGSAGVVDIKYLRLEQLTREDLVAELETKYPDGGPANLLRNSRLPLGLQSGWALGRDNSDLDDVRIAPDAGTIGPCGFPSLKVEPVDPDEFVVIRTEPFGVLCPVAKHAAGARVKGEGEWTLSVHADGGTLAGSKVTLGDEWRVARVDFMPRLLCKTYEMRIEGSGRLWIDALQVGPASKAGTFESAGECEVALGLPGSDADTARVQFDDEPAKVRYCVTGRAAGARLVAKVVDLYGNEIDIPPTELGRRTIERGALRYDVFPERPYGAFRIEAWVERDGRRTSPPNELVVHRLRRPRHWMEDAPHSPFGVHTNSTTRHILMAKAAGVNWTRFHDAGLPYIGWWNLEPERGKWRFFDKEIKRYRRYGVKIFAELGTAPKWASYWPDSGRKEFGYFDKFFQPKDLDDYARYVRTVAERYKGVIDAWDVWNEPWIHAWWGVDWDEKIGGRAGFVTSKEPMRDFARLMRTASETALSVDPRATVAGVNSTTGGSGDNHFGGREWTKGVLDAGGLDHCDVIVYHHYTNAMAAFPGDTCAKGFETATGPIREKLGRIPKPVWMTEGQGSIGMHASGFYNHTLPYEDGENVVDTSNRLCRYVVGLLAAGVERVFLYTMHGHGSFSATPSGWRVLVTQEGQFHPSGAAHSTLAWNLEDTRYVETVELAEGVYAFLFEGVRERAAEAVAVLAAKAPDTGYAVPRVPGVRAMDLFGNRVRAGEALSTELVYMSGRMGLRRLKRGLER